MSKHTREADVLPRPVLVKTREAARLFGTTERTLLNWRNAGCPHRKEAGVVKYDPVQVNAWHERTYGVNADSAAAPTK